MSWQNGLLSWFLRRRVRALRHSPLDPVRVRQGAEKMIWPARPATGWVIREMEDLTVKASDAASTPSRVSSSTPADGLPASAPKASAPPAIATAPVLSTPGRVPGEWITTASPRLLKTTRRVVLYLHGGGYFFCSPRTHRAITCTLARRGLARVCAPDYRLAPEYPAPAALDDALRVWHALRDSGEPADQIVVAGDSAGGGLALALLQALRDAGEPMPAAAVLFSPWTDLALTGATLESHAGTDVLMDAQGLHDATALVLGAGGLDAHDPRISPLYGDFHGLPPLLIQASDVEMLLDDARRVAERAREAGVNVTLEITSGVPHAWQMFAPVLPEARRALVRAAQFIRCHTHPNRQA
ncbi:alpha/beta hydrolase [Robbsia andropogonis]|uniref:alpha/beta hydrolase n=1 Tax=Robbsia andropogonis TaxID=28092 RepID=UPI000467DC83|nr:alpha/beta hydrolase [Robbsia andropogonis]